MLKIASWNVNSIKVRLEQVLAWLEDQQVDVLALQETKLLDELFPKHVFTDLGYQVIFSGQKTYNGVAIVSRKKIEDVITDILHLDGTQKRFIAATIAGIRIINLYVPNGSEVGSEKYQYKLTWLEGVRRFIREQLNDYPLLAVVGDFNIAPKDEDVHNPAAWEGSVLVSPAEREAFAKLLALGLTDIFRAQHPEAKAFTWWDYRALGFRRNHGLRIDHILVSDQLKTHCAEVGIDVEPRRAERPSDHAPIWAVFSCS